MNSLAALQRQMRDFMLDPQQPTGIERAVIGSPAAGVDERLHVYAHAYPARLKEVLRNDFPGLLALAGDDAFDELAGDYIAKHPSRYTNVRWYGDSLGSFLAEDARWSSICSFASMAEFEWSLGLAFDAPDTKPIDVAAIAATAPQDWPLLRLTLGSSVRRFSTPWNVAAMRRALDRGDPLPDAQRFSRPPPWIIWRKGVAVLHRQLDEDESAALAVAESSGPFAAICESLCAWHPVDAVAMRAGSLLKRWVEDEWIVGTSTEAV
ncbi:MAG: DNA-binding domain-containing protein [Dokdonella sp.]|uniref:DNA-binding domain-containing protein n=1 Tax=Dokdonella sp. TaxID=2291710 RepID=UPI003266FC72